MPRALLAHVVLFVATTALSGCGLFKFGTLEFLPSDGSTSIGPEDQGGERQDLAANELDGGTTPPDMKCNPKFLMIYGNSEVESRQSCWDNLNLQAKSYKAGTERSGCSLRFKPVPITRGMNYALKITYFIENYGNEITNSSFGLIPHVMDLPPRSGEIVPAPHFDFAPNPRNGSHSAEIIFESTRDVFDLVLDFQYKAVTSPPSDMAKWSISDLTLSTACPR
jgi:hypothetical protein